MHAREPGSHAFTVVSQGAAMYQCEPEATIDAKSFYRDSRARSDAR